MFVLDFFYLTYLCRYFCLEHVHFASTLIFPVFHSHRLIQSQIRSSIQISGWWRVPPWSAWCPRESCGRKTYIDLSCWEVAMMLRNWPTEVNHHHSEHFLTFMLTRVSVSIYRYVSIFVPVWDCWKKGCYTSIGIVVPEMLTRFYSAFLGNQIFLFSNIVLRLVVPKM